MGGRQSVSRRPVAVTPYHQNTNTPRSSQSPTHFNISPTPTTATPDYTVFISHAGEDKATIAIPLREKLMKHGISAFVDHMDMPVGTQAKNAMESAMQTAKIAVIVLSPEFVARKWPVKELLYFLKRREETAGGNEPPVIIPFFYRLEIHEIYKEPRFDRRDMHGNPIYLESRFLERMKNGEPEANVETLKASLQELHNTMGVLNDIDASNDCAHIMHRRREILLQELCDRILQAVNAPLVTTPANQTEITRTGDVFHAHFDAAPEVSDLVLDFSTQRDNPNASTQEAKLVAMLLDHSRSSNRTISVRGIGGVGKTSLVRGISCLDAVKKRFNDGVYQFCLGTEGTQNDLIEELSKAVERSGGRKKAEALRTEKKVENAIVLARSWFEKKKCLFIVDDAWETKEISRSVLCELLKLHILGEDSKVLLTTRSTEITSWAGTYFPLEPRSTTGDESRKILMLYAGIKPENDSDNKAVNDILERCYGLPLFLAVAGKAVKVLGLRCGHHRCAAYHVYARNMRNNRQSMLTKDVDLYKRLDASLMISLDILEGRKNELGFEVCLGIREMYRRLSVLRTQSKVPIGMLKFLWELQDDSQAAIIAGEFEKLGLVDVEFETRGYEHIELLSLHESLYEFAVEETRKHGEETLGHEVLLRGYGQVLAVKERYHEWWHKRLEADGYIHGNLCRHLLSAGRASELVALLVSPQWTERQLKVNGLPFLEADFAYGLKAVRKEMRDEKNEELSDSEKALRLISDAVSLSSGFIVSNAPELGFQLHGRLKRYVECYTAIREYVRWIETEADRPLVICKSSILGEPGGANTRILSIGVPLCCMQIINDGDQFACGSSDGQIAIVNMKLSKVQMQWKAHNNAVVAIAIGRNGTRLISASRDKTAKVWDVETGRCLFVFKGHVDAVRCVVMMEDGSSVISGSQATVADAGSLIQAWASSVQIWDIQVWNVETGCIISKPFTAHADPVDCMAVVENGEVVMGGKDGKLSLWNATTGAQVGKFAGHDYSVRCVAVTPDRRHIVSGSWGEVGVWEVSGRKPIRNLLEEHNNSIDCVAVSRDGHRIASGSWDKKIRVWHLESGEEMCDPLEGHGAGVTGVTFLSSADSLVSCSMDGTLRMWDMRRKKTERRGNWHGDSVTSLCFSPDGSVLVSGSHDGTLRIWSTLSGQQVGDPLEGHSRSVNDVATTPNGRYVVSVSDDRTVRIWDLESCRLHRTLTGDERIWCIAVTPQGDRAVTGSIDEKVRVWDLTTMDGNHDVLEGHNDRVRRVYLTDDGLRIVSVDLQDNVFVWDLDTYNLVKRFKKENAWRLSVKEVFDCIGETTVRLDRPLSIPLYGREIIYGEGADAQVLATMETDVWSWALSPDKKTIGVGLEDGQVGFMQLEI